MQINELYCGNSLELIKDLDKTPNLIILHPPDISMTEYDVPSYLNFLKEIYNSCWDKLDESGVMVSITTDRRMNGIFAKHAEVMKLMVDRKLFDYKIWAKTLKVNFFVPTFAHCLFYAKGKKHTNNKVTEFAPDVWLIDKEPINGYPGKDNFPSKLINQIILNLSNSEDLIFDPFVGSGTTAVCAKKNNRSYIGFDLNQAFIHLAFARLSSVT